MDSVFKFMGLMSASEPWPFWAGCSVRTWHVTSLAQAKVSHCGLCSEVSRRGAFAWKHLCVSWQRQRSICFVQCLLNIT